MATRLFSLQAENKRRKNGETNKLRQEDRPVHDWYRFVLSYPPHLVRTYLTRFDLSANSLVLDPFCGTGTTLVECKKNGIPSIGVEANPMAFFSTRTKINWNIDPDKLLEDGNRLAAIAYDTLSDQDIDDDNGLPLFRRGKMPHADLQTLSPDEWKLVIKDSISPLPLHKALVLLNVINGSSNKDCRDHELLALAKTIVFGISNLHFGPEVGVRRPKDDAVVIRPWLNNLTEMADDLRKFNRADDVRAEVHDLDARHLGGALQPASVDAVITSPPYPNEKDYTRTTRLESVLLGLISSRQELRSVKQGLIRSNTRSVYKNDRDDELVREHPQIQRIAEEIEDRRIALGKTSGFERLYARLTKLYFGGMKRHLADLRTILRPGAHLAYSSWRSGFLSESDDSYWSNTR